MCFIIHKERIGIKPGTVHPTALHAGRFDRLIVPTRIWTAGAWQLSSEFPLRYLPQRFILQLSLGEQALELAVLLAKLLSFFAASMSIPPYWRCQLNNVAAYTYSSAAICSCVLPAAVSFSARRSLRTMFSAQFCFCPAVFSIVLSAQIMGNKTLKKDCPIHWGHARVMNSADKSKEERKCWL
ncbi:hypothetical protein E4P29_04780 [Rhodococcus sp. 1R11]|uniref:hypothetical protein n=1 Tax=Rhodococcus sp. 1R11 TaxID=2559614 RepID=UPI00107177CA|nr:hypothetical protein [Rhodococcus sp. 1R11]TFI45051.1 hypothetical protein E4P29_04780 [Rhodococcus sp. 1R11]